MSRMNDYLISTEALTEEEELSKRAFDIRRDAETFASGKTGPEVYESVLRLLVDLRDSFEGDTDINGFLAISRAIWKIQEEL